MAIATQPISILLVDDQPRFRQGLRTLLNFYTDNGTWRFELVGEAATVEQAVKLTTEQHPALILLDLELSSSDGVQILLRLRRLNYQGKVLVLSAHHEDEWVFRAMEAGAQGYIFKDCLAQQLCQAIATVMKNEIYLSPEVATSFFRMFHFYAGNSLQAVAALNLTTREQEVLHWLVQGCSNEEISLRLHVSVATVKAHLTSIFEKLSVTSRTQAIIKALKLGLVKASLGN